MTFDNIVSLNYVITLHIYSGSRTPPWGITSLSIPAGQYCPAIQTAL
jgi:hypothetical protein